MCLICVCFFFLNDEYSKGIIILFEERESSLILFGCRSYQVRLMKIENL